MSKKAFVYIVECRDGSLYCGYTKNIETRIALHNMGKGAKYTRGRLPVCLVYSEICGSVSEALKREYCIKKFSRKKKLLLIDSSKN